jgi:hypothetical protein
MSGESHDKGNSRLVFAIILIAVGAFWALRKLGIYIELPDIFWENIIYPIRDFFFRISHFLFTWPMILIIIGVVMLVGKRSTGFVFLIVGGVFILPRIFFVPGLTMSLFFPVLLIGIGVAIMAKRI